MTHYSRTTVAVMTAAPTADLGEDAARRSWPGAGTSSGLPPACHRPSSPSRRAILTALLLHAGRVICTDELRDLLWDEPPPLAASNIRSHLSGVRADLGRWEVGLQGRLHTINGGGGYLMQISHDELDLRAFTRLATQGRAEFLGGDVETALRTLDSACRLWHGPFGTGLPETRWFASHAAAMNNARIDALQDLYAARILTGVDPMMTACDIERTIAEATHRERLWLLLASTQYLNNDIANALGTIARCRSVLDQDLGVHLPPELVALQSAILGWETDQIRRLVATGGGRTQIRGQVGTAQPTRAPQPTQIG